MHKHGLRRELEHFILSFFVQRDLFPTIIAFPVTFRFDLEVPNQQFQHWGNNENTRGEIIMDKYKTKYILEIDSNSSTIIQLLLKTARA